MILNRIDKKLFELRKRSKEISIMIINLRGNNCEYLTISTKLYDLEIDSSKVVEEIKILETQRKLMKRNRI